MESKPMTLMDLRNKNRLDAWNLRRCEHAAGRKLTDDALDAVRKDLRKLFAKGLPLFCDEQAM